MTLPNGLVVVSAVAAPYSASEKLEIVRLGEQSRLLAWRALDKLGVWRPTFYRWYDLYRRFSEAGLEDHRAGRSARGSPRFP
jgi:transposase-like protein